MGLSTEGIWSRMQESLALFAEEVLCFVHNLHNSVQFQNLNLVALVLSRSLLCSLSFPRLSSGKALSITLRAPKFSGAILFAKDMLTCSIKQHPVPPLLPAVILSVLKIT